MDYIELSKENVVEEAKKLANDIKKNFNPDVIIFVAKGAFYIGDEISKNLKVPLIEIYATRNGGKIKNKIQPILMLLPRRIKKKLRELEIKIGIHKTKETRKIELENKYLEKIKEYKNVVLVDDSVDTGNTINQILKFLENYNLNIKVAAINVFSDSKKLVKIDYYNYTDKLINGPWSGDSKYYVEFLGDYRKWKK